MFLEIFWGYWFDCIEEFDVGNGRWEIDFFGFNDVVYIINIWYSVKELNFYREYRMLKEESKVIIKEKGLLISFYFVVYDLFFEFFLVFNLIEY